MGKTYKFKLQWLKFKDEVGPFSAWCKKINDETVLCWVCDKKISSVTKGLAALKQHASTSCHLSNIQSKLSGSQLFLKPVEVLPSSTIPLQSATKITDPSTSQVQLFHSRESATRAEIIWTLKTVQNNLSSNTCDDLKEVFNAMFECVPRDFSLGRTKLTYLITEALGPYFKKDLLNDIQNCFYTLMFDETTNNASKKELQFRIRYWSEFERQVVCRHLQLVFLGHATANDIVREIKTVLQTSNLNINNLLMLGSDGPKVNQKVWNIINNILLEERKQGLLNIGTCNLHIVHNAFLKGLTEFGETACELVTDIYYFFKKFPSRWNDYETSQTKVGVKSHKFVKHVSSRWLTAGQACERLLEQWPAVKDYFFIYIPKTEKQLLKTVKYQRIAKALKYIDIETEITFVIESAKLFSTFSEIFQRTEPLIHTLYTEIDVILKKIVGRICKQDTNSNDAISTEHLLKASAVECSDAVMKHINLLKETDKFNVLRKIQRHYMAAFNYLVKKENKLLKLCQCLQPNEVAKQESVKMVGELAKYFSFISVDFLTVKDEWRILQTTEITDCFSEMRIDHFWREIFLKKDASGKKKYPTLEKLVKAVLSLSHGNADVERAFSNSKRILTEDRSLMSERVLNDRLIIKDSLKRYKNVSEVPITKELIKLANNAYSSYQAHVEEEKRKKEQSVKEKEDRQRKMKLEKQMQDELLNKKESIKQLENKIEEMHVEKMEAQKSADLLLKEANMRLKTAIKSNDLAGVRVAQGMLEGAEKLRINEREKEGKEIKLNKIVNKRKKVLIDHFITKKQKESI